MYHSDIDRLMDDAISEAKGLHDMRIEHNRDTAPPHTQGDRPLVLMPADLAAVEAVPLADRDLPASTYELLVRSATRYGQDPALYLLGEDGPDWRRAPCWSFADLLGRVHQAANLYAALGLAPGKTVGLLLPNTGHTFAALLGAQAAGIAAPVNPMLSQQHIAGILALCEAQILVAAGPRLAPEVWAKAVGVAGRLPGLKALIAVGAAQDGTTSRCSRQRSPRTGWRSRTGLALVTWPRTSTPAAPRERRRSRRTGMPTRCTWPGRSAARAASSTVRSRSPDCPCSTSTRCT